jgi:hypothetical protein
MITKTLFDRFVGKEIYSYTMTNKSGTSATIITWGGVIQSIKVPDKNGVLADVVCGFDNMHDYFEDRATHTGALIGRYGNRIAGGGFEIDGVFYPINNNETGRWHLHGGLVGNPVLEFPQNNVLYHFSVPSFETRRRPCPDNMSQPPSVYHLAAALGSAKTSRPTVRRGVDRRRAIW